jgi:hypothetical protein
MEELYFIVSSLDSTTFYSGENSACDFRVKLYKPLTLKGRWEVGLLTYMLETSDPIPAIQLVQSPLCDSIVVVGGKSRLPVMKHLARSSAEETVWTFDPPTYVPVIQSFIESLEVTITGVDGVTPSFANGTSTCVLHLRRRE